MSIPDMPMHLQLQLHNLNGSYDSYPLRAFDEYKTPKPVLKEISILKAET